MKFTFSFSKQAWKAFKSVTYAMTPLKVSPPPTLNGVLMGVYPHHWAATVVFIASDGHRFAFASAHPKESCAERMSLWVPAEQVALLKKQDIAELEVTDHTGVDKFTPYDVITKDLMPTGGVIVKAQALKDVLKGVGKESDVRFCVVNNGSSKVLRVYVTTKGKPDATIDLPLSTVDRAAWECRINARYLHEALRGASLTKAETIRITQPGDSTDPIGLWYEGRKTAQSLFSVIMPLRW